MIFDGALDFSSPKSPSAAHHRRVGRHLTQNWSEMLRNDDSENHVLCTQRMSMRYQGHARRSLEVSKCIWKVSETFQNFVKIMIFMVRSTLLQRCIEA